ncbi:toxin glutamine deamidase domain-containing protein [Nocardia sp. NPDC003345]
MSLYLPEEMRWLGWIAGAEWPDGDEDRAWEVSGVWKEAANELLALLAAIDEAKAATMAAYPAGGAREEIGAQYDALRSGESSLEALANSMLGTADSTFDIGTELQAQKLTIIITLCWLAIEIALAWLFPPTAPAVEAAAVGTTRATLQAMTTAVQRAISALASKLGAPTIKRGFWKSLLAGKPVMPTAKGWGQFGQEVLQGAAEEGLINGAIQGGQLAAGKRDEFNWEEWGYGVGAGGFAEPIGSAVAKGMNKGFGNVFGGQFGNIWGRAGQNTVVGATSDGVAGIFGSLFVSAISGQSLADTLTGIGVAGGFIQGGLVGAADPSTFGFGPMGNGSGWAGGNGEVFGRNDPALDDSGGGDGSVSGEQIPAPPEQSERSPGQVDGFRPDPQTGERGNQNTREQPGGPRTAPTGGDFTSRQSLGSSGGPHGLAGGQQPLPGAINGNIGEFGSNEPNRGGGNEFGQSSQGGGRFGESFQGGNEFGESSEGGEKSGKTDGERDGRFGESTEGGDRFGESSEGGEKSGKTDGERGGSESNRADGSSEDQRVSKDGTQDGHTGDRSTEFSETSNSDDREDRRSDPARSETEKDGQRSDQNVSDTADSRSGRSDIENGPPQGRFGDGPVVAPPPPAGTTQNTGPQPPPPGQAATSTQTSGQPQPGKAESTAGQSSSSAQRLESPAANTPVETGVVTSTGESDTVSPARTDPVPEVNSETEEARPVTGQGPAIPAEQRDDIDWAGLAGPEYAGKWDSWDGMPSGLADTRISGEFLAPPPVLVDPGMPSPPPGTANPAPQSPTPAVQQNPPAQSQSSPAQSSPAQPQSSPAHRAPPVHQGGQPSGIEAEEGAGRPKRPYPGTETSPEPEQQPSKKPRAESATGDRRGQSSTQSSTPVPVPVTAGPQNPPTPQPAPPAHTAQQATPITDPAAAPAPAPAPPVRGRPAPPPILTNPSKTRVFGPELLAPIENPEQQRTLEDALRGDDGKFVRYADPRTHPTGDTPYGRLINVRGPGVLGRGNNCLDCAISGLATFLGRPEIAAPRFPDIVDGVVDTMGNEKKALSRVFHMLRTYPDSYRDANRTVPEQFAALHDWIGHLGEGSAAFVNNEWPVIDPATGAPVLENGQPKVYAHATVIVYPQGADGPVWWDPQSGKMTDGPPPEMVAATTKLDFIAIPPGRVILDETAFAPPAPAPPPVTPPGPPVRPVNAVPDPPARLPDPTLGRTFGPHHLDPVEHPGLQKVLEDALRDGTGGFVAGADPRTYPNPVNPYGRMINAGGPVLPGRAANKFDAALSALSSFLGNPQVAAPRHPDLGPNGFDGKDERGGHERAAQWLQSRPNYFDRSEPVAQQYSHLHNWMRHLGPGSAALVFSVIPQRDPATGAVLRDPQNRPLTIMQPTVIVYPTTASGPVWWNPVTGETWESPPQNLVVSTAGFGFIPIPPGRAVDTSPPPPASVPSATTAGPAGTPGDRGNTASTRFEPLTDPSGTPLGLRERLRHLLHRAAGQAPVPAAEPIELAPQPDLSVHTQAPPPERVVHPAPESTGRTGDPLPPRPEPEPDRAVADPQPPAPPANESGGTRGEPRRFSDEADGQRYGDEWLAHIYRELPQNQRDAVYRYTDASISVNRLLRAEHPDVEEYLAHLRAQSASWQTLTAIAGDLPGSNDVRDLGIRPDLTPEQREVVDRVAAHPEPARYLRELRTAHRELDRLRTWLGAEPSRAAFDRRIAEIDAAVSHPLPEAVQAVREVDDVAFMIARDGAPLGNRDPSLLAGTRQQDPAYLSTSLGAGADFGEKSIRIDLVVPEGAPALWVGSQSAFDERELVLPRGTRYEITAVRPDGVTDEGVPRWVLEATVLPADPPPETGDARESEPEIAQGAPPDDTDTDIRMTEPSSSTSETRPSETAGTKRPLPEPQPDAGPVKRPQLEETTQPAPPAVPPAGPVTQAPLPQPVDSQQSHLPAPVHDRPWPGLRLPNGNDTRMYGPGWLAPLEDPALQQEFEDSMRGPDGDYVKYADPRTFPSPDNPYGSRLNAGGSTAPGRNKNCCDCSVSGLMTFLGLPQVALPRYHQIVNGVVDTGGSDGIDQTRLYQMLGNQPNSFNNGYRSINEQFLAIHDYVKNLGEGAAAYVSFHWQPTDPRTGRPMVRNGQPVLSGHATLVVFPVGAKGPVWWDPQGGIMSDRPTLRLTYSTKRVDFIPIPPGRTVLPGLAESPAPVALPAPVTPAAVQQPVLAPIHQRPEPPAVLDNPSGSRRFEPGGLRKVEHPGFQKALEDALRDGNGGYRANADPRTHPRPDHPYAKMVNPGGTALWGRGTNRFDAALSALSTFLGKPEVAARREPDPTIAGNEKADENDGRDRAIGWLGSEPTGFDATLPMARQYDAVHNWIANLGPGSAALVLPAKPELDPRTGLPHTTPDGRVTVGDPEPLVVVYPPSATGPVWWNPLTGETWDTPPPALVDATGELEFVPIPPGRIIADPGVAAPAPRPASPVVADRELPPGPVADGQATVPGPARESEPETRPAIQLSEPELPQPAARPAPGADPPQPAPPPVGPHPGTPAESPAPVPPRPAPPPPRHGHPPPPMRLADPVGSRAYGPGQLAPLEGPGPQRDLEQAMRGKDGTFARYADPRVHPTGGRPYGELVNAPGRTAPGRETNCVDCSLASLATFFGRPTVAAPAFFRVANSVIDRTDPETGGVERIMHTFRTGFDSYDHDGRSVPEQFEAITNWVAHLGPGSAAVVTNRWQAIHPVTKKPMTNPDGTPKTAGAHAVVVVYPENAAGPVWWDPQSGEMSVRPPKNMDQRSVSVEFLPIPPGRTIVDEPPAGNPPLPPPRTGSRPLPAIAPRRRRPAAMLLADPAAGRRFERGHLDELEHPGYLTVLQNALRDRDGNFVVAADPRSYPTTDLPYGRLVNGGGPVSPERTYNKVDAALSGLSSFLGTPRVAVPRYPDHGLGQGYRDDESGALHRLQFWGRTNLARFGSEIGPEAAHFPALHNWVDGLGEGAAAAAVIGIGKRDPHSGRLVSSFGDDTEILLVVYPVGATGPVWWNPVTGQTWDAPPAHEYPDAVDFRFLEVPPGRRVDGQSGTQANVGPLVRPNVSPPEPPRRLAPPAADRDQYFGPVDPAAQQALEVALGDGRGGFIGAADPRTFPTPGNPYRALVNRVDPATPGFGLNTFDAALSALSSFFGSPQAAASRPPEAGPDDEDAGAGDGLDRLLRWAQTDLDDFPAQSMADQFAALHDWVKHLGPGAAAVAVGATVEVDPATGTFDRTLPDDQLVVTGAAAPLVVFPRGAPEPVWWDPVTGEVWDRPPPALIRRTAYLNFVAFPPGRTIETTSAENGGAHDPAGDPLDIDLDEGVTDESAATERGTGTESSPAGASGRPSVLHRPDADRRLAPPAGYDRGGRGNRPGDRDVVPGGDSGHRRDPAVSELVGADGDGGLHGGGDRRPGTDRTADLSAADTDRTVADRGERGQRRIPGQRDLGTETGGTVLDGDREGDATAQSDEQRRDGGRGVGELAAGAGRDLARDGDDGVLTDGPDPAAASGRAGGVPGVRGHGRPQRRRPIEWSLPTGFRAPGADGVSWLPPGSVPVDADDREPRTDRPETPPGAGGPAPEPEVDIPFTLNDPGANPA